MNKLLERRLVHEVKEKVSKDLAAEEIGQITMTTLSILADFLRKHGAFDGARLFDYACNSVNKHLEVEWD